VRESYWLAKGNLADQKRRAVGISKGGSGSYGGYATLAGVGGLNGTPNRVRSKRSPSSRRVESDPLF